MLLADLDVVFSNLSLWQIHKTTYREIRESKYVWNKKQRAVKEKEDPCFCHIALKNEKGKRQMKWLILSERNNGTIKSKKVLEKRGNVAEINTAQDLETFKLRVWNTVEFMGSLALQQPRKQSLETLISFSVSESDRRYMPGKTAWGFGVISRDLVSQMQVIPSWHWVQISPGKYDCLNCFLRELSVCMDWSFSQKVYEHWALVAKSGSMYTKYILSSFWAQSYFTFLRLLYVDTNYVFC